MPIDCNSKITLTNLKVTPRATKTTSFRMIQQRYGDGYTARRQDGINPVIEVWDVSTPPMSICDAEAFEQELIANGNGFFSWCAPNESEESSWILDPVSWDWSFDTTDMASLSFSLRRWNGT